ncbi:MAG: hypothetical protein JNM44_09745 [Chitinophagaceae bacterium]|nr:hypothetical protein [Chitinophagaceae bacterium]
MSRFLLVAGLFIVQSCHPNKSPLLKDYFFLIGKWNSVGTDLVEEWSLQHDSLLSKSIIIKNDSLVEVDRSCIVQSGNELYLFTHISSNQRTKYSYLLTYDMNEKLWVFKNHSAYPQVIHYGYRSVDKTVYSFAINNQTKLEFLFEKINK